MLQDHGLQLGGRDLEAAHLDQFLLAVHDVPFCRGGRGVAGAGDDVAGAKVPFAIEMVGVGVVAVVACDDGGATDQELAGGAWRCDVVVVVVYESDYSAECG